MTYAINISTKHPAYAYVKGINHLSDSKFASRITVNLGMDDRKTTAKPENIRPGYTELRGTRKGFF